MTFDPDRRDELFDSAWLKWGQAVVHSQTLDADIEALGNGPDGVGIFTVRAEYQPKRHGFAIYLDSIGPIPIRWSLMLGDIANNFRGSLDHAAWAIVSRGKTPPSALPDKAQRNIYFPIAYDRETFKASLNGNLPGARRADIARVRRYQPYQRGARARRLHALSLLVSINNGDKHRTLHPVWSIPMDAEYEVVHRNDCTIPNQRGRAYRDPLQVGMELNFVRAKKTGPNPELEVKAVMTVKPSLDNLILVERWLHIAKIWIFSLLREFSSPPEELLSIGIDFDRLDLGPTGPT